MAVDVQLWIEDASTGKPRVTNCYRSHLEEMPEEDEYIVLLGELNTRVGSNIRVEQDLKQNIAWFYVEVPQWTDDDHEAALAAGYLDAGFVESYDEEDWPWAMRHTEDPAARQAATRTVADMGLYDDIEADLNRARDLVRGLTPKIGKDIPELDDVACDDIDAGLEELTSAVQEVRVALSHRRVVLHRD